MFAVNRKFELLFFFIILHLNQLVVDLVKEIKYLLSEEDADDK